MVVMNDKKRLGNMSVSELIEIILRKDDVEANLREQIKKLQGNIEELMDYNAELEMQIESNNSHVTK